MKNFQSDEIVKSMINGSQTSKLATEKKEKKTDRICILITKSLHEAIKRKAQEKELPVNSYINTVLKDSVK